MRGVPRFVHPGKWIVILNTFSKTKISIEIRSVM